MFPGRFFADAIAWLRERDVLLPGSRRWPALVARARSDGDDRLWATLAAAATVEQTRVLEGLLEVAEGSRFSDLERWRKGSADPTSVRCFAIRTRTRTATVIPRARSASKAARGGAGPVTHGGAYDAAIARGRTPREAMDLLIAHGLDERRDGGGDRVRADARSPSPAAGGQQPRTQGEPALAMSEAELARARERLAAQVWPLSALRAEQRRLWSGAVVVDELGCGWEHGRVLVPIRGRSGALRGVLRCAPRRDRAPKMLVAGTRLGLGSPSRC